MSVQYLHPPSAQRAPVFRRLAAALRPGGTLLVVAHHPSDLRTTIPRPSLPDLFFTGDDVVALLDPAEWDIVTNAAPGREATDPEGRVVTIHDTVFRARRHAEAAAFGRRDLRPAGTCQPARTSIVSATSSGNRSGSRWSPPGTSILRHPGMRAAIASSHSMSGG